MCRSGIALACVMAIVGLAGCRRAVHAEPPPAKTGYAADGRVEQVTEDVPDDSRYRVEEGDTFDSSLVLHAPAPQYPAALLARQLPPVTVRVSMVVDASGAVTHVTPLNADEVEPAFITATVDALMTWRFSPLTRTRNGVAEPLPYSEIERFVFRQVNGRAVVEK